LHYFYFNFNFKFTHDGFPRFYYFVDFQKIFWEEVDKKQEWYSVEFGQLELSPEQSKLEFEKMDQNYLMYICLATVLFLSWFAAIIVFQILVLRENIKLGKNFGEG
jgi:hypothetical protein